MIRTFTNTDTRSLLAQCYSISRARVSIDPTKLRGRIK